MSSQRVVLKVLVLPGVLMLVAGCDPLTKPYTWQPSGSNQANLEAEVADKQDLLIGQPDGGADGMLAAAAVDRLRRDRTRALPAIDTSGAGGGGSSSGGSGGGSSGASN
jgi:hypothetical protein